MSQITIGTLATQTRTNVPTIRYYEEIGLLPHAQRGPNGHRYYREADLKRLTFIKRCRDFGFPIEQVRELVKLFEDGDRSCLEVREMAQMHLDALRAKLEEIRQLEASLQSFVESCDDACSKGPTRSCAIIKDLSASESLRQPEGSVSCCGTTPKLAKQTKSVKPPGFSEVRRT
jgi:DNA-binding transcriptional MerR regulator